MDIKKFPVRKNIGNLEIWPASRENTGNLVCSSCLILKVKDIAILATQISDSFRSWIDLPCQFCVCDSHKSHKLGQGKCTVRQGKNRENTGNLNCNFSRDPVLCDLASVMIKVMISIEMMYIALV